MSTLLALLAALIAEMHARSAVHALSFCGVGPGQERGESADSFEELMHQWPGQLP